MNIVLYLSTHINRRPYPQYPHDEDDSECDLINTMYRNGLGEINKLDFGNLYREFLGSVNSQSEESDAKCVEVSTERKCRSEEMSENEFEGLKKRLAKNCPKKEKCNRCSIDKGDCPLLQGWEREKEGDKYFYLYPLLGEYLPELKQVVLYKYNIDDACGKPTYNGVLSTYIHELFHAYFHYVSETKQVEYNYIREIEEAMTEFSTLVFLRVMEKMYDDKWSDIFEWTSKSIGRKQETAGALPAYGFGRYLFENIPENEVFDWINKYAERLGYIDEEDELVKQYKRMVYPCYPADPDKCLKLLRKMLFETSNKPIPPREVKKSDDGMDDVVIVDYIPPYDSFVWKGEIHIEYDLSTDVFKYSNGFFGRWNLSDKDIARIKAFLKDENNLRDFFDGRKAYSAPEMIKTEHDRTYTLRIKWKEQDKTIHVGFGSRIPFKHPF